MAPSHLIPLFDMCTKGFYTLTYIGGVNWTLQTADGEAITSVGSMQAVHHFLFISQWGLLCAE